jgi:hypothetical protein
VTPLEKWLSDATRGLSAESAAQVRAEIQQHYDSACEAGDDGIAALGDPRVSNRAYRKVLLTEREAMMAPLLTQAKPLGVRRILLTSALSAVFLWWLSLKDHFPGFLPVMLAIFCTMPLTWLSPPTTLDRSRINVYANGVRTLLVVAVAWWYQGWIVALILGAVLSGLDYFLRYRRLTVLRKLAAGQTLRLLPEAPGVRNELRLTPLEAIVLYNLDKGEPHENLSGAVVLLIVVGMAVWLPATYLPMAAWVVAAHLTRRTIPFHTEETSRWFRIGKWTAMAMAALLPVLYGARMPWSGAPFLALLFILFDLRNISLRRKLPVGQWPKRLYW